MDRGTYAAASAGLFHLRKLDIVNNNLANSNTTGFKRELLVPEQQTFDTTLAKELDGRDPYAKGDHERTPGIMNIKSVTDFSQGPISKTGNPLDVALRDSKDFFVINTPDGPQYTRAGNFMLNESGSLVTADGFEVAGDGGAIITNGPGVKITPSGTVIANGVEAGQLQVVRFDDPTVLRRAGGTRFILPSEAPAPQQVDAEVEPESLEMSNVSVITSMIDLITTNRGFDAYSKVAKTIDDLNQSSINQIGRRS